jgi:hypothetical protein
MLLNTSIYTFLYTNVYVILLFVAVLSPSLVASKCLMVSLPTDGSLHLYSSQRLAEQVIITPMYLLCLDNYVDIKCNYYVIFRRLYL